MNEAKSTLETPPIVNLEAYGLREKNECVYTLTGIIVWSWNTCTQFFSSFKYFLSLYFLLMTLAYRSLVQFINGWRTNQRKFIAPS